LNGFLIETDIFCINEMQIQTNIRNIIMKYEEKCPEGNKDFVRSDEMDRESDNIGMLR
jgi:hypothetical protein